MLTSPFFFVIIKNINDDPDKLPVITAYAHGKTIETKPCRFSATIDLSQCAQVGDIYALDVPAGYPLQLSLSTDVSDAQWALLAVYEDADGKPGPVSPESSSPARALAVTVESSSDPVKQTRRRRKSTSPSVREAKQGLLIWSIKTA